MKVAGILALEIVQRETGVVVAYLLRDHSEELKGRHTYQIIQRKMKVVGINLCSLWTDTSSSARLPFTQFPGTFREYAGKLCTVPRISVEKILMNPSITQFSDINSKKQQQILRMNKVPILEVEKKSPEKRLLWEEKDIGKKKETSELAEIF
ncbi:hypothetical protein AVEN_267980-1 [Araneus ventricosus]|uniref:Uncharacterized protein n=1 Tax=Araneus ventricosus TaxID=182803 RepID=A0A4Y2IZG7_ARAVE|nr:hypothetical protein AVEN_267980-1 [Araneus ventricosus]